MIHESYYPKGNIPWNISVLEIVLTWKRRTGKKQEMMFPLLFVIFIKGRES